MTADDLTRRAIIAAHDAECVSQCGEDATTFRTLRTSERAIVELWRDDRDDILKGAAANALNITARAETAEAELERLHSWGGLLELLDEHWPADIFPMPCGLDDAKSTTRRDTGPIILALIRWVDELNAEVERLRTVTGMAEVAGADILDERNNALAAIERVEKLREYWDTHDPYRVSIHANQLRAALDGTEAPDG